MTSLSRRYGVNVWKNVRFGSLAAPHHPNSPRSAIGGEADLENAGNRGFLTSANGQERTECLDLAQRPVRRLPEAVFEIGPLCQSSQDKLIGKEEYSQ